MGEIDDRQRSTGSGADGVNVGRLASYLLLAAIFAAAASAIVYELLIGSTSSYFLGDSVEEFSLTIGFFLFAMGLGSWASRLVQEQLLERFIALEMWLGLVGGSSVLVLYAAYAYTSQYRYCMILLVVTIGGLIGLELPLLTRILRQSGTLRTILANVLSMDYLGSLVAALLFPYLLLPLLGALHTAVVAGLANALVAVSLLLYFWQHLPAGARGRLALQAGLIVAALVVVGIMSDPFRRRWEDSFYGDRIVHSEQSSYQRIVLTEWQGDVRLFLDGHLQFSSADEHRYHEALVHPAMSLTSTRQRVLIIGGGDGLSAREVLKYPEVEVVDLVDLDPGVTDLARRDLRLTRLNDNALSRRQLRVHNEDGFTFLQRPHEAYGVIILDLPDPRVEALTKLYSVEAYRLCQRHLSPGGVVVTQASSPYYARRTFWSIGATMEAADLQVTSYHVLVPAFGEWGFHLGTLTAPTALSDLELAVPTRFLRPEMLDGMVRFDPDMSPVPHVAVNHLDRPVLARYYREDWQRW
ncbi:polyamine aminopropyltransferase [Candidatus Latescibacterota bacterium]